MSASNASMIKSQIKWPLILLEHVKLLVRPQIGRREHYPMQFL